MNTLTTELCRHLASSFKALNFTGHKHTAVVKVFVWLDTQILIQDLPFVWLDTQILIQDLPFVWLDTQL